MFTRAIILALAAVAVAVPTNLARQDSCGSDSTVHCCNNETAEKVTGHGLIPINADIADLQNLLGQCNDITVAVLGGAVPIKNLCSQQAVCCGEIEQKVIESPNYSKVISTNNGILGSHQPRLHPSQPIDTHIYSEVSFEKWVAWLFAVVEGDSSQLCLSMRCAE
jgi:hypothetical protein